MNENAKRPNSLAYGSLEACDRASIILRELGFRLTYTSMKSEACYYKLPGFDGVVRIAAHRLGRTEHRKMSSPVVANVTFGLCQGNLSQQQIGQRVTFALGKYLTERLKAEACNPVAQPDSAAAF